MILVLGGTTEGRELCAELDRRGVANLMSLAGRTADPLLSESVRVGGFGGVDGLRRFLVENDVAAVVDATHPFAAGITRNAAEACTALGVRLIRVDRPGWSAHPHAGRWVWVEDHEAAASAVVALGSGRVLLTVGRQHTLDYSPALDDHFVLARAAEPPAGTLPKSSRARSSSLGGTKWSTAPRTSTSTTRAERLGESNVSLPSLRSISLP